MRQGYWQIGETVRRVAFFVFLGQLLIFSGYGRTVIGAEVRMPDVTNASSRVASVYSQVTPGYKPRRAQQIKLDGQLVGHMVVAHNANKGELLIFDRSYARSMKRHFSGVITVRYTGVVDLSRTGPLPTGTAPAKSLKSHGLTFPAIVLRISVKERPDSGQSQSGQARRVQKGGYQEYLALLDARTLEEIFFDTIVSRRDGVYMGASVVSYRVIATDGVIKLVAMLRNRLSRSRSKCREPKPFPVEYKWNGTRFVLHLDSIQSLRTGCG